MFYSVSIGSKSSTHKSVINSIGTPGSARSKWSNEIINNIISVLERAKTQDRTMSTTNGSLGDDDIDQTLPAIDVTSSAEPFEVTLVASKLIASSDEQYI